MKKIIILAFAVLTTTGIVSSCTKDNSVKPVAKKTIVADKNDVGVGDAADSTSTGGH